MRRACDYHAPLIITRAKAPSVAMLSLEVYEAL
ncbi:type II toxin-antitoxin system Phd/YefM family antitoxin [Halomonas sp. M4R1S46]|nr:type II toxin-antitoxin system Phd/YefM family antitoxin [Halomonas sp. M4R1S46]UYG06615.1 type II toxin-antitoxin system Phd/YefM family antitoxin [Halomonas sp. M4R1S46]